MIWVPICFKLQQNSDNQPTSIEAIELLQDAEPLCFPYGGKACEIKATL